MLTIRTISNIYKNTWENFLRTECIPGFSTMTANFNILKSNLDSITEGNPTLKLKIDEFIFSDLAIKQPNQFYIKQIQLPQNFTLDREYLEGIQAINLGESFFNEELNNQIQILTSRYTCSLNNSIKTISMLIRVTETDHNPQQNFFCNVIIDFENHFISFGYHKNTSEKYLNNSINWKANLEQFLIGNIFPLFSIRMSVFNPIKLKKMLLHLYSDLSTEIENKFAERLPDNIDTLVNNFLAGASITFSEKSKKQLYAIIFQDYGNMDSDVFQEDIYENGWVFRFVFKEGKCTKASSRKEDYSPIYTSPVYWNLKELISPEDGLEDVGFVWKVNFNGQNETLKIRFDILNDCICYYFYTLNESYREEKSAYVREKIRSSLQTLYPEGTN